jgi:hypothetical protein
MSETYTELQEFVVHQAAEDAALPASERSYQAELVADVLSREAPNPQALKKLLNLYKTEKQAV